MPSRANSKQPGSTIFIKRDFFSALTDLVSHMVSPRSRRNMSGSGGPLPPQRHAIIDQSLAEFDLHLFEAAQPSVDVPAGTLERSGQGHRVSSRLGGGAGGVRPDDEPRVAEKAHAAQYRVPRGGVDDCLQKRL